MHRGSGPPQKHCKKRVGPESPTRARASPCSCRGLTAVGDTLLFPPSTWRQRIDEGVDVGNGGFSTVESILQTLILLDSTKTHQAPSRTQINMANHEKSDATRGDPVGDYKCRVWLNGTP